MSGVTLLTIGVSVASLILALMTATFKISSMINRSIASSDALRESLDEFKTTSRAEHVEFRREMDEDRVLLAKQDAEIKAHEKTLNNHENRLMFLEGRKIK